MSGVEYISNIIPHYTAYEKSLNEQLDNLKFEEMQKRLSRLYGLVLRYQAETVCFFGRHTFSRFLRNILCLNVYIVLSSADYLACNRRLLKVIGKI